MHGQRFESIHGFVIDWQLHAVKRPDGVDVAGCTKKGLVLLQLFLTHLGAYVKRGTIAEAFRANDLLYDNASVYASVQYFRERTLPALGANEFSTHPEKGGGFRMQLVSIRLPPGGGLDEEPSEGRETEYDEKTEPLDGEGWNYYRELTAELMAQRGRNYYEIAARLKLPVAAVHKKLAELEEWARQKDLRDKLERERTLRQALGSGASV